MATMNTPMNERRVMPDRRMHNTMHMGSSGTSAMHASGSRDAEHHDTHARKMSAFDWLPMLLLTIGGLNWGLVGLFDFDLVARLFGEGSALSRIIYVAVGLSALYSLYMYSKVSGDRH